MKWNEIGRNEVKNDFLFKLTNFLEEFSQGRLEVNGLILSKTAKMAIFGKKLLIKNINDFLFEKSL